MKSRSRHCCGQEKKQKSLQGLENDEFKYKATVYEDKY